MIGRLFTILSALSLLLFVAVVVVWAWSFTSVLLVHHAEMRRLNRWPMFERWYYKSVQYAVADGCVGREVQGFEVSDAAFTDQFVYRPGQWSYEIRQWREGEGRGLSDSWWFERKSSSSPGFESGVVRWDYHGVRLPLWPVAAVAFPLPAVRLVRAWRRFRRKRAGRCPSCGYDLRATPDRCPECGAKAGS